VQRILAVYDQHRTIGHVTMAPTLFQAVANALHWWEVVWRDFGTARRLSDDTVVDVIATGGGCYHVRVGRVRKWLTER
jgi:hypothetical protein